MIREVRNNYRAPFIPCPNDGRCGNNTHRSDSQAYKDCLNARSGQQLLNHRLAEPTPPPPAPTEEVADEDSIFNMLEEYGLYNEGTEVYDNSIRVTGENTFTPIYISRTGNESNEEIRESIIDALESFDKEDAFASNDYPVEMPVTAYSAWLSEDEDFYHEAARKMRGVELDGTPETRRILDLIDSLPRGDREELERELSRRKLQDLAGVVDGEVNLPSWPDDVPEIIEFKVDEPTFDGRVSQVHFAWGAGGEDEQITCGIEANGRIYYPQGISDSSPLSDFQRSKVEGYARKAAERVKDLTEQLQYESFRDNPDAYAAFAQDMPI